MKPLLTILSILAIAPAFASDTVLPVSMDSPVMGIPRTAANDRPWVGLGDWPAVTKWTHPQAPTPAPQSFGIAGYYSFCSKKPAVIAMQRVGGINNFFGLGFTPDVSVLLGGDIDGIVRAGGSLTVSWTPKGSNLSLIGGLGADWPLQDFDFDKVGVGVVLGLKYEVRF